MLSIFEKLIISRINCIIELLGILMRDFPVRVKRNRFITIGGGTVRVTPIRYPPSGGFIKTHFWFTNITKYIGFTPTTLTSHSFSTLSLLFIIFTIFFFLSLFTHFIYWVS